MCIRITFFVYIFFHLNGNTFSCNLESVRVRKPREGVAMCLDIAVRMHGGGRVGEGSCDVEVVGVTMVMCDNFGSG
ncbi:hypothetical protein GYH30_040969 [Glycine max]|nr:hypothetical protein GYH30_040969 [Glycine max]